MVPRSDEFECEGQRLEAKVTRDKNEKLLSHPHSQCIVRAAPYATKYGQETGPFLGRWGGEGVMGVHADGGLHAVYVW